MTRARPAVVIASIALAATLAGGPAPADPPGLKTLAIGAKAPDFRLPGVDGKTYSLADFAAAKVLVVAFTSNHCPTAQAYEGRLQKLADEYGPKGVALVAINPNSPEGVTLDELGYTDVGDSFEDMKVRANDHHFTYPYLDDGATQSTAIAYGVLATPHIYVFDAARALRYVGRFDDAEVKAVTSHDAINAVDALLAGRPVPVETTRVVGCSTKWADKKANAVKAVAKWDAEPVTIDPIDEAGVAKLMANETDRLLVVNVWATWCGPCLGELPEFVTINRMYRGRKFRLVTISMDEPESRAEALRALADRHVSATNYLMAAKDKDRFCANLDKDWPGPIPYTIVVAPGGKVLYRKLNAVDPLELRRAIVGYLGRTY